MTWISALAIFIYCILVASFGALLHEGAHYMVARWYTDNIEVEIWSREPYILPQNPSDLTDLGWRIFCAAPFLLGALLSIPFISIVWPISILDLLLAAPFFGMLYFLTTSDLYGIFYPKQSKRFCIQHPEPPTFREGIQLLRQELSHE